MRSAGKVRVCTCGEFVPIPTSPEAEFSASTAGQVVMSATVAGSPPSAVAASGASVSGIMPALKTTDAPETPAAKVVLPSQPRPRPLVFEASKQKKTPSSLDAEVRLHSQLDAVDARNPVLPLWLTLLSVVALAFCSAEIYRHWRVAETRYLSRDLGIYLLVTFPAVIGGLILARWLRGAEFGTPRQLVVNILALVSLPPTLWIIVVELFLSSGMTSDLGVGIGMVLGGLVEMTLTVVLFLILFDFDSMDQLMTAVAVGGLKLLLFIIAFIVVALTSMHEVHDLVTVPVK